MDGAEYFEVEDPPPYEYELFESFAAAVASAGFRCVQGGDLCDESIYHRVVSL